MGELYFENLGEYEPQDSAHRHPQPWGKHAVLAYGAGHEVMWNLVHATDAEINAAAAVKLKSIQDEIGANPELQPLTPLERVDQ